MSALLAPQGRETPKRPVLRAVRNRPTRLARIPFVIVLALYVGLGLVGVLVLNVQLQERAGQLNDLTAQDTQLGYQQAALAGQVDQLSSTTGLMQQAVKMGMVPNTHPAFIDLRNHSVLGKPTAVTGGLPVIGQYVPADKQDAALSAQQSADASPSAKPSAAPSASASPKPAAASSAKPGTTASTAPSTKTGTKASAAPSARPTATAGGH